MTLSCLLEDANEAEFKGVDECLFKELLYIVLLLCLELLELVEAVSLDAEWVNGVRHLADDEVDAVDQLTVIVGQILDLHLCMFEEDAICCIVLRRTLLCQLVQLLRH